MGARGGGEGRNPRGPPDEGSGEQGSSGPAWDGPPTPTAGPAREHPLHGREGSARPRVSGERRGRWLLGRRSAAPCLSPPSSRPQLCPADGEVSVGHRPGTAGGGVRQEPVLCSPGVFSCGFPRASWQDLKPRVAARRAVTAWIARGSCVDHTSCRGRGAVPARGSTRPVPAGLREGGSVEFKRIKLSEVIYPVS